MPDLEITCSECSTPFMFTEREQEYYRERNLTHPKRCKPCRDARRANFGGSKGQGGGGDVKDLRSPAISVARTIQCRSSHQPAGRFYAAIVLARVARNREPEQFRPALLRRASFGHKH